MKMIPVRSALSLRQRLVRFGSSASTINFNHEITLEKPQEGLNLKYIHESALPHEVHASKLSNGVSFYCIEDHSPISTFSISIRAGSRFEKPGFFGLSSVLKQFAFEDTKTRSKIVFSRSLQDSGSNLHAELNREALTINVETLRVNLDEVVHLLSSIITAPDYSFHKTERAKKAAMFEAERVDGDAKFVDILHKTSFRSALGNPIHPSVSQIDSINKEALESFAAEAFKPSNIAIIATGTEFQHIYDICGQQFGSLKGEKTASTSKYHGGETIIGALDEENRHAIAFEGPSLNSQERYALSVLQHALGGSSFVFGGKGASRLPVSLGVECFSFQYSDASLFGFFTKRGSSSLEAAISELKKISSAPISASELSSSKSKVKAEALFGVEKRLSRNSFLASQLLNSTSVTDFNTLINNIDSVTSSDVQKLALKLIQSKPTTITAAD